MAPHVKMIAAEAEHLSPTLESHMVEESNWLSQLVLRPPYVNCGADRHMGGTHTQIKDKIFQIGKNNQALKRVGFLSLFTLPPPSLQKTCHIIPLTPVAANDKCQATTLWHGCSLPVQCPSGLGCDPVGGCWSISFFLRAAQDSARDSKSSLRHGGRMTSFWGHDPSVGRRGVHYIES